MVGSAASPAPGTSARDAAPRLQTLDVVLLVVLAVAWGSAYNFIREGILLGASPILFALVRYFLSAAAFVAIALARREPFPSRSALRVSMLIGGPLVIGLYGGFLYWGEQFTTGGYASVLASTAPVLTVVVAYGLLPFERLGGRGWVGLAIGFVGAIVLVIPQLAGSPIGTWEGPPFVIAAFLTTAIGTVLLRRLGGGRQGLWQIGAQFAVAGLVLAAAALVLPVPEFLPSTAGVWLSLGALVLVSSVAGYFIYFLLHYRVGPVRSNTVAYLIPLVGVGIGSGLLGEPLTIWEVVGFVVVVVGVSLILWDSSRRLSAPANVRPA